jgi:phage shock protein PspC (stress-responsive transcriptional regulator)
MATKRLYRSTSDRMVAGVCGGLAAYLDLDPTLVRILWVIVVLFGGFGVLLYLIMWIIVPEAPPTAWQPGPPGA